jgi:uncharacterized protein YcbK (DUF882 family)|tara:strand:+ start:565 stop:960 length:396 start_codon:yes stop_codon:yes gene_type:complete
MIYVDTNMGGQMEQLTKNFNLSEFICHCGCGSDYINRDLVDMLQKVRDDMPMQNTMTVTSGVRCEKHNSQIGGSLTSSHIDGVAVDLKCETGSYRQQILEQLFKHFNRIGIAKNFIHVDIDPAKVPSVWIY